VPNPPDPLLVAGALAGALPEGCRATLLVSYGMDLVGMLVPEDGQGSAYARAKDCEALLERALTDLRRNLGEALRHLLGLHEESYTSTLSHRRKKALEEFNKSRVNKITKGQFLRRYEAALLLELAVGLCELVRPTAA
jgi:hypothetical protein